MKLGLLFTLALAALVAVEAGVIDYDKVQPFPEPEPKTVSERAAVKFKPSLSILNGCYSYATVNAAGDTSGGLDPKASDEECNGPALGSQIYSRSGWYRDVWAIMYACGIVWLNNLALENQTLLGLSVSQAGIFYTTPDAILMDAFMNGTHPQMEYRAARAALENGDFGPATPAPFNDANFKKNLERGWIGPDAVSATTLSRPLFKTGATRDTSASTTRVASSGIDDLCYLLEVTVKKAQPSVADPTTTVRLNSSTSAFQNGSDPGFNCVDTRCAALALIALIKTVAAPGSNASTKNVNTLMLRPHQAYSVCSARSSGSTATNVEQLATPGSASTRQLVCSKTDVTGTPNASTTFASRSPSPPATRSATWFALQAATARTARTNVVAPTWTANASTPLLVYTRTAATQASYNN
ncbi:hypothetical protein ON010_g5793 [Phytophthora cinnamomi]|nr:hypothetical protein ON010_g5793 [Phytophthora cinnamomi]